MSKGKCSDAIQVWYSFCMHIHTACEAFTKELFKMFSDFSKPFPKIVYCCKLNGGLTHPKKLVASKDTSESPVEISEALSDLEKN